jgi:hypothetical protein
MSYHFHGSVSGFHPHGNGLFAGVSAPPPPPPPPPPPSGTVQIAVLGQTVLVSGACANTVSATATLTAASPSNGAVTQGPQSLTITGGTNYTGTFTGVPPGSYSSALVTLIGFGGSTPISSAAFDLLGLDGEATALSVNAPVVTVNPASQSVPVGSQVTLTSAATGNPTPTPQWQASANGTSGWITLANGATATLQFTAEESSNGWSYRCRWTNSAGEVFSSNAIVTVLPMAVSPTITTQPVSQAVQAGGSFTFSVSATGSAPLAYQWRRNGVNISGATSQSYTATATLADNGAVFTCVVSNSGGSATSAGATLTVTAALVAPSFSVQPQAQVVGEGQPVQFTALAQGSAPISYQWRRNGANIAGATAASYTLPSALLADSGAVFSVRATNSAGSVDSAGAVLTVTQGATPPPPPPVVFKSFMDMAPDLALDLVDCPEAFVMLELREAAIVFYAATRAWRAEIVPMSLVAGQTTYALAGLPTNAVLAGLPGLLLDGKPLLEQRGDREEADGALRVMVASETAIALTPEAARTGQQITGHVALAPARNASGIPARLYAEHREAINALAMSRLMMQLGKPWHNPNMAAKHASDYQRWALKFSSEAGTRSHRPRLAVRSSSF